MRFVVATVLLAASACGPDEDTGACKDNLLAGDLIITEVFADYAAPSGGTGTDDGKEWFEIYNNADRPVSLKGVTVVHSRPDGSKSASHTMEDVTVAPGQFFTLGNATDDLVPAYVDYGYSADLGGFYNSDGGKLALKCGDSEIDSATYDMVKSGHSRQLGNQAPPDYQLNDDTANWCEAADTEFEANNFGTPGQDNDCAPVIAGSCTDTEGMRPTVPPMPGDLVITELMPNPAAVPDGDGEWFEITALNAVDLNGVQIDRAGDSTNPETVESTSCVHLEAGAYGVFAKSSDMAMNGGLPAASLLGTFKFSLTAASSPGDVQILSGGNLIDAVTFTSEPAGKARQLDPDSIDPVANDTESSFCDATAAYGDGDLGTPGAENGPCPVVVAPGMCNDGGTPRAIVKPAAGAVVITELMPHPAAGNNGPAEWFEITNVGAAAFDLNSLGLDRAGDSRKPDLVDLTDCTSLAPGAFALFARGNTAATNGGLTDVDATFGFNMVDNSGNAQVVDPSTCDTASPYDCTTIYDAVTWGNVSSGTYTGKSLQLDPDFFDPTMNDVATGADTKWCVGATPYGDGTNLGTPRMANAQCAGI